MASTEQHTHEEPGRLGDEGAAPDGPTDLKARSWRGVLSRTVKEFKDDNLTDVGGRADLLRHARDLPGAASRWSRSSG